MVPQPGTPGSESAASRPSIPGYEILGELGRGGMGIVWKAQDLRLKRVVAIKQLLLAGQAQPEHLARFRAEAEAIAKLQHPHIVQVFQAGEHEGQPFFVLEFVTGGSLDRKCQSDQPQPPREAARLIMLLARAVHAAHQAGVIHRDLKPGNVLLAPAADEPALNTMWGCPKVTDFGLARILDGEQRGSVTGMVMGTPSYMAPEQAEGRLSDVGPATDVWALGVMFYELLTGKLPFKSKSVTSTLMQVCTHEPDPVRRVRPDVPEALEVVVQRCLRKKPRERYPSAAALADDLKRWLAGETTTEYRPPVRRAPWLTVAAVGVLALALMAVGGWWMSGWFAAVTPETSTARPTEPVMVAEPYKGWIDILVSDMANPTKPPLRLYEPKARPLHPGQEVRIEVVLKNRPGYVYVLWVDAKGKVIPIYPWEDSDDWNSRPKQEKPIHGRRQLPETGVYPIEESPEGVETLVMLVRETPLPADVDVPGLIGDLGPQTATDREYVRWFENGQLVTTEDGRAPGGRSEASDPGERTQQRIKQRLGDRFEFSRAVSFFNLGKR